MTRFIRRRSLAATFTATALLTTYAFRRRAIAQTTVEHPPASGQPPTPRTENGPSEQHEDGRAGGDGQTDHLPETQSRPARVEAPSQAPAGNDLHDTERNQQDVHHSSSIPEVSPLFAGLKLTDYLSATASALAVVVAYLQLRILRGQAKTMRFQARIANCTLKETAIAAAAATASADAALKGLEAAGRLSINTQRAYLFVSPTIGLVVDEAEALQSIFLQPVITNRGLTPAMRITGWTTMGIRPTPLEDGYDFSSAPSETDLNSSILGPSENGRGVIIPVTLSQVDDAMAERSFIYLWGGVDYHDIFDGTPVRITRYCLRLVKGNDRADVPFTLMSHRHFNFAT